MDRQKLVRYGGLGLWAAIMIAYLASGAGWLLWAAIVAIVVQFALGAAARRR